MPRRRISFIASSANDQSYRSGPAPAVASSADIPEPIRRKSPVGLIAAVVGLLVLAYWWLDPNPPKTVKLATAATWAIH